MFGILMFILFELISWKVTEIHWLQEAHLQARYNFYKQQNLIIIYVQKTNTMFTFIEHSTYAATSIEASLTFWRSLKT